MDKFTPTVISSRPANDHLNMVKAQHLDIVSGIQNQALKVNEYNQNKILAGKEKAAVDAEANKNNIADMRKQQELELKRMALMA